MVLSLVLTIILFVCVAMLVREGLWSNAVTFFNTVFAGLVATTLFEPLANWLDGMVPRGTYLWDFAALWGIFCITAAILRALTDFVSRVRVRFKKPVEMIGGFFFAFCVAWTMVCFTSMTLHTAPLAPEFLWGAFYDKNSDDIFWDVTAPDRQWLGLVQQVSAGALSTTVAAEAGGKVTKKVFDPKGRFIDTYGGRRADYEKVKGVFLE